MFNRLRGRFCPDIAIDLGTANTVVGTQQRGILLDEPSVVAVRQGTRQVLGRGGAVGRLAKQMIGRTPDGVSAVRPLRGGVVTDFELCEAMIAYFLRKAGRQAFGLRPRVLVTIPAGVTQVERQAVFAAADRAGAGRTYLLDGALAAGIGAGLPLAEPLASMVCDLGGGTTEIAVLCLGEVVSRESLRIGGEDCDTAIAELLHRDYSLKVGPQSAERLKLELGSALPLEEELTCEVSGLDAVSGTPRKAVLTSEDVRSALAEPLGKIEAALRRVIERCPPELVADLSDHGLILTGGMALLRGIDRHFTDCLGIPVRRARNPRHIAARGLMVCLEEFRSWQGMLDDGDGT